MTVKNLLYITSSNASTAGSLLTEVVTVSLAATPLCKSVSVNNNLVSDISLYLCLIYHQLYNCSVLFSFVTHFASVKTLSEKKVKDIP